MRVTVKQPDSREISGFFVAIFSAVTQFDVCPVGWCNCRMEFMRRTGAYPAGRFSSGFVVLVWEGFVRPDCYFAVTGLRAIVA